MDASPTEDVAGRLFLAVGRLSRSLRQAGGPGPGHGSISALATLVAQGPLRDQRGQRGDRPVPRPWPAGLAQRPRQPPHSQEQPAC
ncbi:MAG TPA: hypothetical protein VHC18_06110, partial [Amycolatopsis sp.]|nr:hypothetical protein [Amycolatopsis sp.]